MKRNNALILSLLAIATLSGCSGGGNNESASSSSAGASSDSSSPTSVSTDTVDIYFWHAFGQSAQAALTTCAADFQELIKENLGVNVEIHLEYQGGYDDILEKTTKGFATGNVPTIAIAYPDHVANYLGQGSDFVYNVEDFYTSSEYGFNTQSYLGDGPNYGYDDFVETFIEEGTNYAYEGMYSFPFMKSTEIMFYNTEAVANGMKTYAGAADYADPADFVESLDWDGLIDFGKHCMENKSTVLDTLESAIWYDSDENLFISKLFQNNIGYSSIVDGVGHVDFETGENRTKAEAFVTSLKEAYDADKTFVTKGTENNEYGSNAFTAGETIFEIGSSGGTGYNEPQGQQFTVGVAAVPASNDNPLYVTQGPTMTFLRNPALSDSVNETRVKYAWMFAKYLTNPEINTYMCVYGSQGYVPVRYSAYETSAFQSYLSDPDSILSKSATVVINDIAGRYLNTATFVGSSELREQCGGIISGVLLDIKDVTSAFTDAIAQAKTAFATTN